MTKEYLQIGSREFEIKPMVLGQVRQMKELLGYDFTKAAPGKENIEIEKLGLFLAIIFTDKGKSNSEKDVNEVAKYIEDNLEISKMQEAVNFFLTNLSGQLPPQLPESQGSEMQLITRPRHKKKK